MGGHALDTAIAILGELTDISALGSIQYPNVAIEGQSEKLRRRNADHLLDDMPGDGRQSRILHTPRGSLDGCGMSKPPQRRWHRQRAQDWPRRMTP